MFHQRIENGHQVEEPDPWLREGFPWEIERIELAQTVHFGGYPESFTDHAGETRRRWVNTHDVLAIPFDIPIPGYRNDVVNTLRLWSAAATDEFDLDEFNAGGYADAAGCVSLSCTQIFSASRSYSSPWCSRQSRSMSCRLAETRKYCCLSLSACPDSVSAFGYRTIVMFSASFLAATASA